MKRLLAVLAVFLVGTPPASAADDIDQINQLIQADFLKLSEDLGAALSYKAVIPATPLGLTGFDLGVEVTATQLQNRDAWDRASSSTAPDTLYVPRLHLHKGLPLGFEELQSVTNGGFHPLVAQSRPSGHGAAAA